MTSKRGKGNDKQEGKGNDKQQGRGEALTAQVDYGAAYGVAEDLAVVEGDAAAGETRHLGIVGDHDDGVARGVEALEEIDDDALVGGVEVSGGLVGEEDGRVVDQGTGDADALLLSSAELAGEVAGAGAEADAIEGCPGFALVGHGVEVLGEHDVFYRGEVGDEVELLEDEADLVGAEAVELGGAHGGDIDAVDPELSGGGAVEAAEEVDEGGFAGAGGAGDGDPLAGDDGEAGVVEGADGSGVACVFAGDGGERDDGALGACLIGDDVGAGFDAAQGTSSPPPYLGLKVFEVETLSLDFGVDLPGLWVQGKGPAGRAFP